MIGGDGVQIRLDAADQLEQFGQGFSGFFQRKQFQLEIRLLKRNEPII